LPVSGEGVLARFSFQPTGDQIAVIQFEKAKLVARSLETIPVVSTGFVIESQAAIMAPASEETVPEVTVPQTRPTSVAPANQTSDLIKWLIGGLLVVGGGAIGLTLVWQRRTEPPKTHSFQATAITPPPQVNRTALPNTKSPEVLLAQAEAALAQNEPRQAYHLFDRLTQLQPRNSAAWLGKGQTARHKAEKQLCYQRALALDPHNVSLHQALQKLGES
jgi:hypothetical protein